MRHPTMKWVALGLLFCSAVTSTCAASLSDAHWVDTWGAVPDTVGPALRSQTVRQILRVSIGGAQLRIRLSNLYGSGPVVIGPVHIALHANHLAIRPESDHAITFDGKATVTVAKGQSVLSDPVALRVAPLQELAVSIYLPGDTGPSTMHALGMSTAYVTQGGDATAAVDLAGSKRFSSRVFLTDVEVAAPPSARALVAFGDSITDGYASTPDADHRWPDMLADRLQSDPALSSIAVVNSGISGNRILNDGAGPSALSRFDRDALEKPGVRWILLLEGINDIGAASMLPTAKNDVSAQQIIDGMKTLIARAHARGIKIYGATLTPFGGMKWPYYTGAGEVKRQAINSWIRTSGAFDAVVDFDKATRDPAHPDHYLPAFDSGDHLHPSDAGYKAMANAIDLRLFAPHR